MIEESQHENALERTPPSVSEEGDIKLPSQKSSELDRTTSLEDLFTQLGEVTRDDLTNLTLYRQQLRSSGLLEPLRKGIEQLGVAQDELRVKREGLERNVAKIQTTIDTYEADSQKLHAKEQQLSKLQQNDLAIRKLIDCPDESINMAVSFDAKVYREFLRQYRPPLLVRMGLRSEASHKAVQFKIFLEEGIQTAHQGSKNLHQRKLSADKSLQDAKTKVTSSEHGGGSYISEAISKPLCSYISEMLKPFTRTVGLTTGDISKLGFTFDSLFRALEGVERSFRSREEVTTYMKDGPGIELLELIDKESELKNQHTAHTKEKNRAEQELGSLRARITESTDHGEIRELTKEAQQKESEQRGADYGIRKANETLEELGRWKERYSDRDKKRRELASNEELRDEVQNLLDKSLLQDIPGQHDDSLALLMNGISLAKIDLIRQVKESVERWIERELTARLGEVEGCKGKDLKSIFEENRRDLYPRATLETFCKSGGRAVILPVGPESGRFYFETPWIVIPQNVDIDGVRKALAPFLTPSEREERFFFDYGTATADFILDSNVRTPYVSINEIGRFNRDDLFRGKRWNYARHVLGLSVEAYQSYSKISEYCASADRSILVTDRETFVCFRNKADYDRYGSRKVEENKICIYHQGKEVHHDLGPRLDLGNYKYEIAELTVSSDENGASIFGVGITYDGLPFEYLTISTS